MTEDDEGVSNWKFSLGPLFQSKGWVLPVWERPRL